MKKKKREEERKSKDLYWPRRSSHGTAIEKQGSKRGEE
jgi:hypothetical protein